LCYKTWGGGSKGNALIYGIGTDVLFFGYFDPYMEFWGSCRSFGKDPFEDQPPTYLSIGTKFLGTGISADLLVDFLVLGERKYEFDDFKPLNKSDTYNIARGWGMRPTWAINLGFAYSYDFYRLAPVTRGGIVSGRVTNAITGDGIDAVISIIGTKLPSIVSDPKTGVYNVEVEPGKLRVVASKDGYNGDSKEVEVRTGRSTTVDFALNPKPAESILTGKVIDKWSGRELKGIQISLSPAKKEDSKLTKKAVSTDSVGFYRIGSISPGTYIVTATIKDYIPQSFPVFVKPNETAILNFELLAEIISLQGVHFELNKSTLLVDSYFILDKVVDFLLDNPDIKVEVAGHTCSIGSDEYNMKLSQMRSESVRQYLIAHGIKPDRITAKGYGETKPVASNETESGRILNRRTELRILKK